MIDVLNDLIGRAAFVNSEVFFYDTEYWACVFIIGIFIYCFFRFLSYLFGGRS